MNHKKMRKKKCFLSKGATGQHTLNLRKFTKKNLISAKFEN